MAGELTTLGLSQGLALVKGAGGVTPNTLAAFGDSTAYSSGATMPSRRWSEMTTTDAGSWSLYNAGVPGQSISDMADGVVADTEHRGWLTVFVDYPNSGETAAGWIADVKRAAASRTGNWFVLPPVLKSPSGQPDSQQAVIEEIQATLLSDPIFAGHTLDATEQAAYKSAMNRDSVRVGGGSLDWLHFNDLGQTIQANYLARMLIRTGALAEKVEATTLVARMSSAPTDDRRRTIAATIARFIGAGLWSKYDFLRLWAAHTEQAGGLNWIADQYNATKFGAITFTADRGRAGDGSTGYHSSNFDPTTAVGPKYARDSMHLSVYSLTNVAESKEDVGSAAALIRSRNADNSRSARGNGATASIASGITTSVGLVTIARRDSTALKNSQGTFSTEGSIANASTAIASGAILEGSGPIQPYSTKQIAAISCGSGLTLEDMQLDYCTKTAYLAALGAL